MCIYEQGAKTQTVVAVREEGIFWHILQRFVVEIIKVFLLILNVSGKNGIYLDVSLYLFSFSSAIW
jgi:hypothetical protein